MGKTKQKTILFGTKHKRWNVKFLNIVYNSIEIKQHAKFKYLECILYESLSVESIALNVIDKTNPLLMFLNRQKPFFNTSFK